MIENIDNTDKGLGKIIPDIYEDGLKSTTQEVGKGLALIPKAINAALAPLRKWIAQKEYNVAETEKLLALKLENVNAESIVSPESYVALPALQAISYCINSAELRDMYANLLSTSMLIDKKENVHPSFVEIIKQLSPDEAKLLKKISENGKSYPLIDVQIQIRDAGYIIKLKNFTLLAEGVCDYPQNIFSYIDNFARLKIIDVSDGVWLNDDELYKPIESYKEILAMVNSPLPEGHSWKIVRKKFDVTQYGRTFIETCVRGVS